MVCSVPQQQLAARSTTSSTSCAGGIAVAAMEGAVRVLLAGVGEDVAREGLADTPQRVAKAMLAMTEGYKQEPAALLKSARFHEPIIQAGCGGLVLVRDIDFAALSQESLLPFYGRVHIAYLPADGVVLGLSKLARLTKLCAKRLASQAGLAAHVLHVLQATLRPRGALVVVTARHLSYTDPAPPAPQTCGAASGCFAGSGGGATDAADAADAAAADAGADAGAPCLQEALELLGCPLAPQQVVLLPDAADPATLRRQCCGCGCPPAAVLTGAGCSGCGARRLEPAVLRGMSASSAAAAAAEGGGGLDSPRGPVTPDPSEHDDTDGSEQGSELGDACAALLGDDAAAAQQQQQPSGAQLQQHQHQHQQRGQCSMEAALALLLAACGVDAGSPQLQAAVRRHVLALLAATSGYHAEQPSRPGAACCNAQHVAQQQQQDAARAGGCSCCNCGSSRQLRRRHSSSSSSPLQPASPVRQQQAPQQQQQPGPQLQQLVTVAAPLPPHQTHEHAVPFMSQCEHHMLPFHGTVHITYLLPSGEGSSGSGGQQQQQPLSAAEAQQLVQVFTRRLQVQERITAQVADAVQRLLAPLGVMVVVRAAHMCMVARGVENHGGSTTTRAALGAYAADSGLRCRVLRAVAAQQAAEDLAEQQQALEQQQARLACLEC